MHQNIKKSYSIITVISVIGIACAGQSKNKDSPSLPEIRALYSLALLNFVNMWCPVDETGQLGLYRLQICSHL